MTPIATRIVERPRLAFIRSCDRCGRVPGGPDAMRCIAVDCGLASRRFGEGVEHHHGQETAA